MPVYFTLARTQVRSFLEVQLQPYPTSSKIRRRVKQGDVHRYGIPFAGPRTHSIQHKTGQNRRKEKSQLDV